MNKLSVVIPTLQKNIELLNNLITTLSRDESVEEIIVIDNSCKNLNATSDKVRVIVPNKNLFVNASWNLGVREAKNEIVALINDDITIPNDFCNDVLVNFPENAGCAGLNIDYVHIGRNFPSGPDKTNLFFEEISNMDLQWGICIFLRKSLFIDIPEELKIFCGDDWIIYQSKKQNKKVYQISGQIIHHNESLSSGENKFKNICKNDKKIFKKLTKNWLQRLFNYGSSKRKHNITFLGFNISFNKKSKFHSECVDLYKNLNTKNITFTNKRACIFAAYNSNGEIAENTIDYINELRKYNDIIIYIADNPVQKKDIRKIANIVDAFQFKKHGEYDFGSYKRGLLLLKEENILDKLDYVLFCNDSVKYIGKSLEDVFNNSREKDFYGITINNGGYKEHDKHYYANLNEPHIQTYFYILSKNIFQTGWLLKFFQNVKKEKNKIDIIRNYEMGLSELIKKQGYELNSFYRFNQNRDPYEEYLKSIMSKSIFKKKNIINNN